MLIVLAARPAGAQDSFTLCGVADAIDYPIDELVEGYDDFGLFRARFGGNHVGIDIGFERWGDPVAASARGRVTYSDPEGWDTEKGVVILEHTFPDSSIAYTLYGHMEQSDTVTFPRVGDCVERGQIIGTIGWPSRGLPHLHYEIRTFLPNDGGPGYVTNNPLDSGWYSPLDFTALWRLRLAPGFIESATFRAVPGVPPVLLDSGVYAVASGSLIAGTLPDGTVLWRVETSGTVTGLAALPGGRVVARTHTGQTITLENGRYLAVWDVPGPDTPLVALGETLVIASADGGLAAYDPLGTALWTVPGPGADVRGVELAASGDQALALTRTGSGVLTRVVGADGALAFEMTYADPVAAAPDRSGGWMLLDGTQVKRIAGGTNHTIGTLAAAPGRAARMAVDVLGNAYIYAGSAGGTLMSVDSAGGERWRIPYTTAGALAPLLATGGGCLLYTLDSDGTLSVFDTTSGDLLRQAQIYAGGRRSGSPAARLLTVDANERVRAAAGYLSVVTLDGWALGGEAAANCRLG
jgi:hypothetical protein